VGGDGCRAMPPLSVEGIQRKAFARLTLEPVGRALPAPKARAHSVVRVEPLPHRPGEDFRSC